MEEKILNEKESLELISQMIKNSQQKLEKGNGTTFLVMGYTTFVVSLLVYYFLVNSGSYLFNLLWFIIPAVGMFMIFKGKEQNKHSKTFIDRTIGNVWLIIGLAAILVSISAFFVRIPVLPIMLLLMGIATTLTGQIIRFTPVIISGLIGIASCTLPFIIGGYMQIIAFGVVFLVMMVIPGHILNLKGKKQHV